MASNAAEFFLSGGFDSRSILAAFDDSPVCFTISISKNNEFRVAQEVAKIKGSQHVFLQLDSDPWSKNMDDLIKLNGGMYAFEEPIFFGFSQQVSSLVDVVFHGHGLDYFFQGMYLPSTRIRLGRFKTDFLRMRKLSEDLVGDFLENIPYRLKGVNLFDFVKDKHKHSMNEALRESVREVIRVGEQCCSTPYDFWEYIMIHALSRHYSNPNLTSMATCAQQRTAAFDNDIFDLYLSLPERHRLGGGVSRLALRYLSPRIAHVKTANTNVRADFNLWQRQLHWFWEVALYFSGHKQRTRFMVTPQERTWPDRELMYRSQPGLKQAAMDLCRSDALDQLDFLDMDKLARTIPAWLSQPRGGGAFMTFLITVDRFLKQ